MNLNQNVARFFVLSLLAVANLTACTSRQSPVPASPAPPTAATRIIQPSQTPDGTLPPTPQRSSTDEAEETSSLRATPVTPTAANTPTLPPPGIFALKFYPPLVLDFDPLVWQDESLYQETSYMLNILSSRQLESCQISVQGPSGFYPTGMKQVQLGGIQYSRDISSFSENVIGAYFAEQGISGYDFSNGIPVLIVSSSPEEWQACQIHAEDLLATLHIPEPINP